MSVLRVMPGLDDARWIQYQTGMCAGWKSGISTRMTSNTITAADAERVHGTLMEREEIVHYDKPITAGDAGGYVFREERKERIQGLTKKTYWTVSFRENLRLAGDECKSKSLQWVHTAGSGFRVHFVEAESLHRR